jgi:hypothetical protein
VARPLFTVTFWVDAAERAVKTAAQSVLLAGFASDAGPVNLFEFDWEAGLGFAAGGAVLSPPGPEAPADPNPPIVAG